MAVRRNDPGDIKTEWRKKKIANEIQIERSNRKEIRNEEQKKK